MKNNYELKQSLLDKMEIEGLIEKIQRLEKQLALKELEVKQLKEQLKPFLNAQEKREDYLKRRDQIDFKLSQMFSKLHS